MKTRFLTLILTIGCGALWAQDPVIAPIDRKLPEYTELKQHLLLTDAQVQSLSALLKTRQDAEQAIYTQIRQKQEAINNLLKAGSKDAVQIGQLTLDVYMLQKQLPVSGQPLRAAALNVLTAEQKNKLPTLTSALQLQTPAWEAVTLNLIDSPNSSDFHILPAVGTASSAGVEMLQNVVTAAPVR